jgi:polyhydroxyalkanoate synthesis regulator phasin
MTMNINDMYWVDNDSDVINNLIQEYEKHIAGYRKVVEVLNNRIKELEQWVGDLQSRMYINCVYCGHRYGPKENTPVSMADILKEHIEVCPQHPMSKLKEENKKLKEEIERLKSENSKMIYHWEG